MCVQRGLVDSLVTRCYLYAEMCNGWAERESQHGARKGELESMKADLTVARDKTYQHLLTDCRNTGLP